MRLWEIEQDIQDVLSRYVDEETGEITDEGFEALQKLEMEREKKIEGVLLGIKNLTAFAAEIKAEKQALEKRQRDAERKAESLKAWVQAVLDGEKFSTPRVAVSYRKTSSLEVTDELALTDWLFVHNREDCLETSIKIKKADVKKLIAGGEEVDGAQIVVSNSMSIK